MSTLKAIIDRIDVLKEEIDALRPISPDRMGRIMQKFRLDWNYHSNHIEGNSLTYGETKSFLLHGITADGKPFKDHLDIQGHNEAILWIEGVVKEDRPLTEAFVRELHKLVPKASYRNPAITPDGQPTTREIKVGEYKTAPNHVKTVTGEMHYFASPEETPAKMGELIEWFRTELEKKELHPLLLAASLHYKFIANPPIDDGNGRVTRILMNMIFMQNGYPPVIIQSSKEKRGKYYSSLQKADGGDLEAFIEFVGERLIHSMELMVKGAKGESIEEEEDLDKKLFLLEQRLSEKKITHTRNEETLSFWLTNFVAPLILQSIETLKKFDAFFLESELFALKDSHTMKEFDEFLNQKTLIENLIEHIITHDRHIFEVKWSWSKLNRKGFKQIGCRQNLKFYFDLEKINIKYNSDDHQNEKSIDLHYDQKNLDELVSRIVKDLANFVYEDIDEQTSPKTDN